MSESIRVEHQYFNKLCWYLNVYHDRSHWRIEQVGSDLHLIASKRLVDIANAFICGLMVSDVHENILSDIH